MPKSTLRVVRRYQTDLTDPEWRVIAPHCRSLAKRAGVGFAVSPPAYFR
jgi:hypothetical protein